MTKHFAVVCFISLAALFAAGSLATSEPDPDTGLSEPRAKLPKNAAEAPDPVEKFLSSAPASAVEKLKNDDAAEEGEAELNEYFARAAIGKLVILHTSVEAAEATPGGRNAFRIRAASTPVKWGGGTMERLSWLYFPEANSPDPGSVPAGAAITVAGVVRRCEVVMKHGAPRLNFDLVQTIIIAYGGGRAAANGGSEEGRDLGKSAGEQDNPGPERPTPLTKEQLISKVPQFYSFDYNADPQPGKRYWLRVSDTTWIERYPDGLQSTFKVVGHATVEGTEGTIVVKVSGDPDQTGTDNDGGLQAFIPDKGSEVMHHWYRNTGRGDTDWNDLGPMHDAE